MQAPIGYFNMNLLPISIHFIEAETEFFVGGALYRRCNNGDKVS